MRVFACFALLCAVAVALASHESQGPAFDEEQSYTYEVEGHVVSGLPNSQSQSQHDGLQLGYKIKVTKIGNTLHLKPKEFRPMKNCQIQCEEAKNKQISPEILEILESPMEVTMNQGKVQIIKLESGLPIWGVNIKKSQLSPFILNENAPASSSSEGREKTVYGQCKVNYKTQQANAEYGQQSQHQPQQMQQQRQQQMGQKQQQGQQMKMSKQQQETQDDVDSRSSSSSEEDNKPGLFRRLASYLPGSDSSSENTQQTSEQQALNKFCGRNDQTFEILKKYVVEECSNVPMLLNATQNAQQQQALKNRVVLTRFLACGPSRQNYQVIRIEREEQSRGAGQPRPDQPAELSQRLILVDISSASARRQERVKQPDFFVNVAYEFNAKQLQAFQQPYAHQPEFQHQLQQAAQQQMEGQNQQSGQQPQQWKWQQQQQQSQPWRWQQQSGYAHHSQIAVYTENFFAGKTATFDLAQGSCHNIPTEWNDMIRSVDAGNSCFILWENKDCSNTGKAIRLERYSYGSQKLELVGMHNVVSSMQMC